MPTAVVTTGRGFLTKAGAAEVIDRSKKGLRRGRRLGQRPARRPSRSIPGRGREAATVSVARRDERLRKMPLLGRPTSRPELDAVAGCILVFALFAVAARGTGMFSGLGIVTFLKVSAQLGIIAVAAALSMIGGEFDLSVGSMMGFAGVVIAVPATVCGWPPWPCIWPSRSRPASARSTAWSPAVRACPPPS